jgi:hypothetical protein
MAKRKQESDDWPPDGLPNTYLGHGHGPLFGVGREFESPFVVWIFHFEK